MVARNIPCLIIVIFSDEVVKMKLLQGADPGFPLEGGANPPLEGANLQIFPKTA